MSTTELTPTEALAAVKRAALAREESIRRSRELYQEADAEQVRLKINAREVHREANRELVRSVRAAQRVPGLTIGTVCKEIGLSYVFFNRLERQIKKWDSDEVTDD